MCCNSKPGPKAAIAFFKKKTGIHVTQADWHKIRTVAEVNLGRPLTNKIADSRVAAIAAAEFAESLNATPEEKKAIIEELSSIRTTEGNIDAINELASNGLPEEVANKTRRVSAQQRDAEAKAAAAGALESELEFDGLTIADMADIVENGARVRATDKAYSVYVGYFDEPGSPYNFEVWAADPVEAQRIVVLWGTRVKGWNPSEFHTKPGRPEPNMPMVASREEIALQEFQAENGQTDSDNLPEYAN